MFNNGTLKQVGSHMVLTDVYKPPATKFINIDSKYSNEYVTHRNKSARTTTLPLAIENVSQIEVTDVQIPLSFYNISANLDNNYFKVLYSVPEVSSDNPIIITIPDGYYTISSLVAEISDQLENNVPNTNYVPGDPDPVPSNAPSTASYDSTNKKITFSLSTASPKLCFAVDRFGNTDVHNFKNKLGWLLGFRNTTYELNTGDYITQTAEQMPQINMRYMFLTLETNIPNLKHTFQSPIAGSMLTPNIIAKIALETSNLSFGDIYCADCKNGRLTSTQTSVTTPNNLVRITYNLIDDTGRDIYLNDCDYSFTLKLTLQ